MNLDSQDITLDIVKVQRRGGGGCHVKGRRLKSGCQ